MLNIKNLTSTVNYSTDGTNHILDFGTLQRNANATVEILVNTKDVENFQSHKTCGCSTTDDIETPDGNTKTTITYKDTHKTHTFSKTIILEYGPKKNRIKERLRIKGTVN